MHPRNAASNMVLLLPVSFLRSARNFPIGVLTGTVVVKAFSMTLVSAATKARPNLYDLLRQIESSDDDVSQRVAQAACDSDTSGSDHAVDDEDDFDSEVSMRCEFVLDSMAAESRSVQSDEGATSSDSDACATD